MPATCPRSVVRPPRSRTVLSRALLAAAILAVALGLSAPVHAVGGNVQFITGPRFLDDGWSPVDEQPALAVHFDVGGGAPIHLDVGLNVSAGREDNVFNPASGDDEDLTVVVIDATVGLLWYPARGSDVQPFLGGGLAHVRTGLEFDDGFDDFDDDDSSLGYYLRGGVFWRIGERFNLGVDLRAIRGTDNRLLAFDQDADSEQIGVLFGFAWGEPGR